MFMYDSFRDTGFGREFDRMQREMNQLFNAATPAARQRFPLVNVWTKEDAALVTAEVPGFESKDFEISALNKSLTISGKREKGETDVKVHREERKPDEFQRTVHLPFVLDSESVQATYEQGVLSITCPRAEADKPKKIEIK